MASAPRSACSPPASIPRIGIFSQIGAIALNVVLDADIHVGETVAVFGLGVPGQLVAQLARLNGARVIARGRRRVAPRARAPTRGRRRRSTPAEGQRRRADPRADRRPRGRRLPRGHGQLPRAARGDPVGRLQLARVRRRLHAGRRRRVSGSARSSTTTASSWSARRSRACSPALQHRWDEYRLQRTFMDLAVSGRVNVTDSSRTSTTSSRAARRSNSSTPRPATCCRSSLKAGAR